MNQLALLLLQADDLGTKQTPYTPGSEGTVARILIGIFIALFIVAAYFAIHMCVRGAIGATKSNKPKEPGLKIE